MTVAERVAHASNRVMDAMRSPKAREVTEGERGNLDALEGHKYLLLTTYKRSGEPVSTPLWLGLAGGKAYIRTYADAVKIKRLRNNPRVLVGPCDPRGKPKGPMVEARARVVAGDERQVAETAIRSNFGLFRRFYLASFSGRVDDAYVEIEA
jgi:PPOX class probable F420-dependent enzyme